MSTEIEMFPELPAEPVALPTWVLESDAALSEAPLPGEPDPELQKAVAKAMAKVKDRHAGAIRSLEAVFKAGAKGDPKAGWKITENLYLFLRDLCWIARNCSYDFTLFWSKEGTEELALAILLGEPKLDEVRDPYEHPDKTCYVPRRFSGDQSPKWYRHFLDMAAGAPTEDWKFYYTSAAETLQTMARMSWKHLVEMEQKRAMDEYNRQPSI